MSQATGQVVCAEKREPGARPSSVDTENASVAMSLDSDVPLPKDNPSAGDHGESADSAGQGCGEREAIPPDHGQ